MTPGGPIQDIKQYIPSQCPEECLTALKGWDSSAEIGTGWGYAELEMEEIQMNIMLVIMAVCVLLKIVDGYKKGMVKEIISLVTLTVIGIMVVLISRGLHSYMEKEIVGVIIAVVLLALLGIVHHLLGVVLFSAKMIAKLPVVHWANKVLGAIFGAFEVILILQIVYVFIMYFGLGMIGQQILEYTRESIVLAKVYQYNVVAKLVENLMGQFPVLWT